MNATLDLTRALIARPSVTPDDAGCQRLLADRLLPLGFNVEWFFCGKVSNVLFTHGCAYSAAQPALWFLGHTDVVPSGPLDDWASPPFKAEVRQDVLYGRGAVDMKGAVAAMVVAAERFVGQHPQHPGQVGILLTSDEEGVAIDGIARVADSLQQRGRAPTFCLVGEPSSHQHLGDTIRIGRRGSIHAHLQVHGVQGHSAFPEKLDNPIHRLAGFLAALTATEWDRGDQNFPPSHCQVTNIRAGTGAENVTPGHAEVWLNFRNSPASPSPALRQRFESLLAQAGITQYDLDWRVSGEPFRSQPGRLRAAVIEVVREHRGFEPELNTGGGTSDGRFIAPLGTEVVELGLLNHSIHQVDERVPVDHLDGLSRLYQGVMERLIRQ